MAILNGHEVLFSVGFPVDSEEPFEVVASNSGTEEAASEITINLTKPCKEIQLAINIPTPPANLSYCGVSIHTVGNNTFTANSNVAIQTTHTNAGVVYAVFKAGANDIQFTINSQANVGKTYAGIQNELVTLQQNGVVGYCGRGWNNASANDYYIDRIVLRPTNSSSAFAAGTNYIVFGR